MSNDSAKPSKFAPFFAAAPTKHAVEVDVARLEKTIDRVRRDSARIDNLKCMIFADRKSGLFPPHALARDEKRLEEEIKARDERITSVNDSLAALKVMGRRSPLAKYDLERFQATWKELMDGIAATDRATERFQRGFDAWKAVKEAGAVELARGAPPETPTSVGGALTPKRPLEEVIRDALATEPALAGTAPAPEISL